jgi:hypothetical protein
MTTYYLDNSAPGASDSNAGTSQALPWQTLAAANAAGYSPGDVISFRAGTTYTGTLGVSNDGTSGNPITFNSYGAGAKPRITTTGSCCIFLHDANWLVVDGLALSGATGVTFNQGGALTIDSTSTNIIVRNMEIFDAGFGVEIHGQNCQFTGNYIHDLKMVVNTPTPNDDFGAVAFTLHPGSTGNDLGYNTILRCKAPSLDYGTDGGGFETWKTVTNTRIHHNWVQDSNGFFEAGGESWDSISGITIDHNVSLNNGSFCAVHNGGDIFSVTVLGLTISHNTIVDASATVVMDFVVAPDTNTHFDHNIMVVNSGGWVAYYPAAPVNRSFNDYFGMIVDEASAPLLTGEISANPLFVSSTDLHLQPGSPAVGLGAYGEFVAQRLLVSGRGILTTAAGRPLTSSGVPVVIGA